MLSGGESTWRPLKEALPRLEGLKAESSILYLQDQAQPVNTKPCHHPSSAASWDDD